jgi:hypothetical protein
MCVCCFCEHGVTGIACGPDSNACQLSIVGALFEDDTMVNSVEVLMAILLVLLLILSAASAIGFRSLRRRIHLADCAAQERSDTLFRQVEGLLAIHAVVGDRAMLPRSRGWAASPDFLHVIIGLMRDRNPATILECSSGLSTLVVAAMCRLKGCGQVFSLEHDPIYAERTRSLIRAHDLTAWAYVIDAPLIFITLKEWQGAWYDISGLPTDLQADLLIVDGPPSTTASLARYPALPMLRERLAAKSWIVIDDADRPDEREIKLRWMRAVPGATELIVDSCEKGCAVIMLP